MSGLHEALEEYLALRRALGFKLRAPASSLHGFVCFLRAEGASHIATDLALRWATRPQDVQPAQWAARLRIVRHFAQHLRAGDPRHEVPPQGLLPHRFRRRAPYVCSRQEVRQLMQAARQLPSQAGLQPESLSAMFGLLAATGMRQSEAIALDRADFDPGSRLLTVRWSKFGKSRLVPVHASTARALQEYASLRDRLCPDPQDRSFFLSDRGARISEWAVRRAFRRVREKAGLKARPGQRPPRLHDLRHRFAVRTLLGWYRGGLDVEQRMPALAAYLGHRLVNDTYWYLTAVPELLRLAAGRLEGKPGRKLP